MWSNEHNVNLCPFRLSHITFYGLNRMLLSSHLRKKWAKFLHVALVLTGKHCPVSFSAVLCFVFEKINNASKNAGFPEPALAANGSIIWKNIWTALFGKDAAKKKNCIFAYIICGKWKKNQWTKIWANVFLWRRRPHAKTELIWKSKKNTA